MTHDLWTTYNRRSARIRASLGVAGRGALLIVSSWRLRRSSWRDQNEFRSCRRAIICQ
jgi:hypothetical protein